MNSKNLEQAQQQVSNPELLVNLVSRRVRQLAQGHRPMVHAGPHMDFADIALREIIEGKLTFELVTPETGEVPPAE